MQVADATYRQIETTRAALRKLDREALERRIRQNRRVVCLRGTSKADLVAMALEDEEGRRPLRAFDACNEAAGWPTLGKTDRALLGEIDGGRTEVWAMDAKRMARSVRKLADAGVLTYDRQQVGLYAGDERYYNIRRAA